MWNDLILVDKSKAYVRKCDIMFQPNSNSVDNIVYVSLFVELNFELNFLIWHICVLENNIDADHVGIFYFGAADFLFIFWLHIYSLFLSIKRSVKRSVKRSIKRSVKAVLKLSAKFLRLHVWNLALASRFISLGTSFVTSHIELAGIYPQRLFKIVVEILAWL